eukprot:TRINITY_DN20315_c0_g1_i1.p1 TRINITY_DN20315_c0_g1~~TRINITY_DN20315_c0_g1_i1.p1  ORF type:complete len:259 (+),score=23.16 TRINITY_DN20315_c0_g1_i1:78-854(+)
MVSRSVRAVDPIAERSAGLDRDPKMCALKDAILAAEPPAFDLVKAAASLEEVSPAADGCSPVADPERPGESLMYSIGSRCSTGPATAASAWSPSTLRFAGCDSVDEASRRARAERPRLLRVDRCHNYEVKHTNATTSIAAPLELHLPRGDAQGRWSETLDRKVHRLSLDIQLANDDRLNEHRHRLRCGRVDAMHDWYNQHRLRGRARLATTPPFIFFGADDCSALPGSLRVTYKGLMKKSESGPSLLGTRIGISPAEG